MHFTAEKPLVMKISDDQVTRFNELRATGDFTDREAAELVWKEFLSQPSAMKITYDSARDFIFEYGEE
jgi:hypothetical protein